MRLKNTSQYPTQEVRDLVEFATKGVRLNRVAIHVKNHEGSYRGMAYEGVPYQSPRYGQRTVDRLITIGIGTRFPRDNMVSSYRKTKWSDRMERGFDLSSLVSPGEGWQLDTTHWSDGVVQYRWVKATRHPYGGLRSPFIEVHDWREALVVVAAHEARHIQQYQRRWSRSEVDAERFAAKRLEAFRNLTQQTT